MPPTPTTRRKNSTSKTGSASKTPSRSKTPATPAKQLVEGAIGTAAKLSPQGQALVKAIRSRAKGREVTLVDYGGGNEVMVKVNGVTAVYLIQKAGSTDITARYRQKGLNITGVGSQVTAAAAADRIIKELDNRPPRATRGAAQAPATSRAKSVSKSVSKTVSRSKSPARAKTGNGEGTLANGLRASARKAGARSKSPSS